MDTRSKILTLSEAVDLRPPLSVVLGFFDPLLAAHVRRLKEVRSSEARLMAVILDPPQPLLDTRARAELVAALAIIDFVVSIKDDAGAFLQRLAPREIVHEETHDELRTAHLIEHVQRRYQLE